MINVTIWNEFRHEKTNEDAKKQYPNGIHAFIKDFLKTDENLNITLAALDDPDFGLPDEVLENTDVLMWWGHKFHDEVSDELATKIQQRVYTKGMGFIALHSAHESKAFKKIVGATGQNGYWSELGERQIVWTIDPAHPIANGVPECIDLAEEEMYGEPFSIPIPEELVFVSWHSGGCVHRSGCCWRRGIGKIFFFQPGHETYRSYYHPAVQRVLKNAIYWANPNSELQPVREAVGNERVLDRLDKNKITY